MAIQGPVVSFELVDEDLHGSSDLVHLQQKLSLLLLVDPWRETGHAGHLYTTQSGHSGQI